MIKTFDFIVYAWRDEELMQYLMHCLTTELDSEIHTELHKIFFRADIKRVDIFPLSESNPFSCKIIPKRMTYSALLKMLNKDFEHFEDGDIIDI